MPVEHANIDVLPSHDVQGPEITAVSISELNQAGHLRAWLGNQLQKELACNPVQVKLIYLSSTKELAETVAQGTVYLQSLTSIDDYQGCETPIAAIFFRIDSNYSQLLEMCSRAQYKLILVIQDNQSLCDLIGRTEAQISVKNICDLDTKPALLTATETGNAGLVRQLVECGASLEVCNSDGLTPLQIATNRGLTEIRQILLDHRAKTSTGINITTFMFIAIFEIIKANYIYGINKQHL